MLDIFINYYMNYFNYIISAISIIFFVITIIIVWLKRRKATSIIDGDLYVSERQTNGGPDPCREVEEISEVRIKGLDISKGQDLWTRSEIK